MKLALFILLGLCAFTARAQFLQSSDLEDFDSGLFAAVDDSNQEKILDYLKRIVEYLKDEAEKNVKEFQEKLKNVANNFINELKKFAENALSNLEQSIKSILGDIEAADNNAVQCLDKYRAELRELVDKTRKNVQNIVANTVGEITSILKNLEEYIKPILAEVENLRNIFNKCVRPTNPIYTFKCLLENVRNVQASLREILKNASQAAKVAITEVRQLVSKTKAEIEKVTKEAEKNAQEILGKIRSCLENGLQGEEYNIEPEEEQEDVLKISEEASEELKKLLQNLYYIR